MTDALEDFDTLGAATALEAFVDDLSNWYVRRARPRFWKSKDTDAFAALHECLGTVAKLLAPFCPFVADEIHLILQGTDAPDDTSVHLEDWPVADPALVDTALEAEMAVARRLTALGRAARGDARVKVRQPLPRALVLLPRGESLSDEVAAQVAEELNVKQLEVVSSLEGLIRYSVVPNFRALGPRLGPKMPAVKAALAQADGGAVARELNQCGMYTVVLDGGETFELGADDVEVRAQEHEEFALAQEGAVRGGPRPAHRRRTARARAWPASWPGRSTTTARRSGWPSPTGSPCGCGPTGRWARPRERHGTWIAGEVLAVEWHANEGDTPDGADTLDLEGTPVRVRVTGPGGAPLRSSG